MDLIETNKSVSEGNTEVTSMDNDYLVRNEEGQVAKDCLKDSSVNLMN